MEYKEGSDSNCGLPLCCRNGTGDAGYWGSYSCDIPERTLDGALEQLSKFDLDFVLWTGDNPPHNIWQ